MPEELGVAEADAAWKAEGSTWRSGRVIKAFGRWNTAIAAAAGRQVPLTPAQRALARKAAGRQGRTLEEYVEGVSLWLAIDPADTSQASYMDFRRQFNDNLPEGMRPLVTNGTLVARIGVGWDEVLELGRGNLTLADLQARRRKDPQLPPGVTWGPLINKVEVADVLGIDARTVEYHAARSDFPPTAARLSRRRLWRRCDVEAYAEERRDRYLTQAEGELQAEIIGTGDMCPRLDTCPQVLTRWVSSGRWDRVPPPEGRLGGGDLFWRRSKVRDWEAQRDREGGGEDSECPRDQP
jgi:hypothetical protein